MKASSKNRPGAQKLSPLQHELLDKLAYFAVFNHPLRAKELQNLLHNYYSFDRVEAALTRLLQAQLCYFFNNHFGLVPTIEADLQKRRQNEENAKQYFAKLPFYVRIIGSFPFVRGVAVSGSLSKGVIHQEGDIDYFIITAHNRLWLTRILLVLFKKIFLLNSRKYFCVNYFVSEKHLEVPDKNIFTATEVATLIPVYGEELMQSFKKANAWFHQYYGHFEQPIDVQLYNPKKQPVKRFIEILLNNPIGNALDILSMHITVWRWHVKFKTFSRTKFDLTLRSTRNVSKHHPRDFQTVVLERVEKNRQTIFSRLLASK